jgi:diguanylate cyclase (GGDEF)-like protein
MHKSAVIEKIPDIVNVLVVDDSEDDAILLLRQLRKGGIRITHKHVDSARSLLNALQSHTWDIVITDHNMHGFSSADALKIIRDFSPDIPVIVVSGTIEEELAVKTMNSGAQDYVMKDNLARLIPVIKRELKHSEFRHAHKQAEEDINYLSYYDRLTGLVNRQEFEKELTVALQEAIAHRIDHVLMVLDLDQFKIINDTCGHVAGDELLKQITKLLKNHIRESDTLARLGGDEFAILLQNCPQDHAMKLAERVLKEVREHRFIWDNKPFNCSISIGMVAINQHSKDYQSLLSSADLACFTAKDKGRNAIAWYRQNDAEFTRRRDEMQWVPRIRLAVEENRFVLHNQPMRCLKTNAINHSEFLVRMLDDDQNIVPPIAFIPSAERYGLMPLIDRWVVKNVFSYLAASGLGNQQMGTYFINLSGSTLSDKSFFDDIKDFLNFYHIIPARICFEITETAAIANLSDAVEFIKETRDRGFKFALDDFGVGLSSFSYLKRIPVDYLKIDGSFVKNMLNDPIDKGIVEACNQIGHAAGLSTIAEFVENDEVCAALKLIGVDYAQGFGIAKPGPL